MAGVTIGGRYDLRERLGSGAMSEVWLADDRKLERSVALKLLAPHADSRRFEREARAAAALSHPNVARIYEYAEADGQAYMALEFLPGGTLEERLRSGPLPDADTERIARQVAAGLAHAHGHGLVHRDLKPANVLFDEEGRAKIADFGIARLEGVDTLTAAGTVLGTANYISPEQAAGEPASPASDVYSYGVILFRLLTGRLPFEADSPLRLAAMHRTDSPPAISSLRPDAPRALGALAAAAMAKDPQQRPADGAALVDALEGTAETGILAVPPETAAQTMVIPLPQPPPIRRRLWIAAIAAAAVLLAAAGITAAVLLNEDTGGSTTTPSTTRHPPATSTTAPTTTTTLSTTTTPSTSTMEPTTTRPTTTQTPPTTTAQPPPTTTTAPPPTTDTIGATETLPVPP